MATSGAALHEDMTLAPLSLYGADKAACEMHARAAARLPDADVGLRFFNVYGSRQAANDAYAGVITPSSIGPRRPAG